MPRRELDISAVFWNKVLCWMLQLVLADQPGFWIVGRSLWLWGWKEIRILPKDESECIRSIAEIRGLITRQGRLGQTKVSGMEQTGGAARETVCKNERRI